MDYLVVLFWSLVGSVLSLAGGLILVKSKSKQKLLIRYSMPFGAGAMLAVAMLNLLPEAMHTLPVSVAMPWVLAGFFAFFVLERGLSWFHHSHHSGHNHNSEEGTKKAKDKTHAALIVFGDTLHSAIDGIALGAAFVVSPETGIGVALAILAHEIPQETSDFGMLLAKGVKPGRVALLNLMSASAMVVASLVTYSLGNMSGFEVGPLLALAAGMFIYVATVDIIPDINRRPHKEAFAQIILFLVGLAIVAGVISSNPHSHDFESSSSDSGESVETDVEDRENDYKHSHDSHHEHNHDHSGDGGHTD